MTRFRRLYVIENVGRYYKGKGRRAEFWNQHDIRSVFFYLQLTLLYNYVGKFSRDTDFSQKMDFISGLGKKSQN